MIIRLWANNIDMLINSRHRWRTAAGSMRHSWDRYAVICSRLWQLNFSFPPRLLHPLPPPQTVMRYRRGRGMERCRYAGGAGGHSGRKARTAVHSKCALCEITSVRRHFQDSNVWETRCVIAFLFWMPGLRRGRHSDITGAVHGTDRSRAPRFLSIIQPSILIDSKG